VPARVATRVFPGQGYWTCEIAIDLKDIQTSAVGASNHVMRVLVARNRVGAKHEKSAIVPVYGSPLNFNLHPFATVEH
jgi:hypothetical protein